MDEELQRRARSFGPVAAAYERGRPGYPREAAAWLVGRGAAEILELGAGTGKLTAELVALGHDVRATDPDPAMLELLRERAPGARATPGSAERDPGGDRAGGVGVMAQAFHWCDPDGALPEIARVLKPGGVLALVWNQRDERIPWVRRLGAVFSSQEPGPEPAAALVESPLFGFVEEQDFKIWQDVNRESIVDLAASRSNIAVLDEEERAAKIAEVLAFYDDYGRGMDGMQLPYVTRCFRATVLPSAHPAAVDDTDGTGIPVDMPGGAAGAATDGSDSDLLLIDFR
jgi:SAM-dependent methyltransferase